MTGEQREKVVAILAANGDDDLMGLAEEADSDGWGDIAEYLRIGYGAGLSHGGLWQCDHCGLAVEDPAHPDHEVGCHILDDGSGCGDTILCDDCHAAATAARAKIVVTDVTDDDGETVGTEEDDDSLTEDEKALAAYLERHDAGTARNARSFIGQYPRDERRQLHRYQDQIDADRAKRGKAQG